MIRTDRSVAFTARVVALDAVLTKPSSPDVCATTYAAACDPLVHGRWDRRHAFWTVALEILEDCKSYAKGTPANNNELLMKGYFFKSSSMPKLDIR